LKQDDLRRRREEQQVEIRRQKREENITKRRNFVPSANADSDEEVSNVSWDPPVSLSSSSQLAHLIDYDYI
jgi:importin subunit alpha-6/7